MSDRAKIPKARPRSGRGVCDQSPLHCGQDRKSAGADVRSRGKSLKRGRGGLRPITVTLYTSPGCGLCERALEVVTEAQEELGFELEIVSIDGDETLEAAYREHLPVVEIDGERAFVYYVDPGALRRKLPAQTS